MITCDTQTVSIAGPAAIVVEACSWLGTPFLHEASVRGARGGVDCVMLFTRVYQATGHVPADFDPRPYPSGLVLPPDDRRFARAVARFFVRVEGPPRPGDFLIFRLDHAFKHGVICVDWPRVIHPVPEGRVCIVPADRGELGAARFSLWRPRGLAA